MRWFWIDRFLEFESGQYATAIKNVTLAEDHLHDHFPAYPVMPASLVLEGLAQTGGLLVFEHGQFEGNPILAKIPSAQFHDEVLPGDTLTYTATLKYVQRGGALVQATSHNGRQLQAEAEIVFARFNGEHHKGMLFDREVFLNMMRLTGAFEVGHTADGRRLVEPPQPVEVLVGAGGNGNGNGKSNGKALPLVPPPRPRPVEPAHAVSR